MADEILIHFEQVVAELTLVPSNEGRFEVSVDGKLLYSRLQTGRHTQPNEVVELLRSHAEEAERIARQGY